MPIDKPVDMVVVDMAYTRVCPFWCTAGWPVDV